MPQVRTGNVSKQILDHLRTELNRRHIPLEGSSCHPVMLDYCLSRYKWLSSVEDARCLLHKLVVKRKSGNETGTTFSLPSSQVYEDMRMRSVLWSVLRRTPSTSRDALTFSILARAARSYCGVEDRNIIYRLAVLNIRLDKSLRGGRPPEKRGRITFRNNIREHTYLRTCESPSYKGLLKFGKTTKSGRIRSDEHLKKFGDGDVLLEIPYNFEDAWKFEFEKWLVKGKKSPEVLSEDVRDLLISRYGKYSIGGCAHEITKWTKS